MEKCGNKSKKQIIWHN